MLSNRDLTPTPTAVSTALDSLRDKIRGFVDIASEEQLREVAQLIDRLSISNKAPFRLGDLPFDLLEYTAQTFFTREEAAPLMRINSTLGEFFANVVWKYIDMAGGKISGKDVSPHALIRNARRIRHVDLTDTHPGFIVSLYFPNATSIAFDLDKSFENMFTLHLSQLLNLRHVSITVLDSSDDSIRATAVKWINSARNSEHVKTISFEIDDASDNQQVLSRNLAALLDQISNKSRIRIPWISLESLSDEIVPFLPSMLTELNLIQSVPEQCMGEVNRQVFGSNTTSIFIHLKILCVQACCNNPELYDFNTFTPDRFKMLNHLSVAVPKTACDGHEKSPLPTIFSKKWVNVTDFELRGNETVMPWGSQIFAALPHLRKCDIVGVRDLAMDFTAQSRYHLRSLALHYSSIISLSTLYGQLPHLSSIELSCMSILIVTLRLMSSCPRLVEVKLNSCSISDEAIAAIHSHPCHSVRRLVISSVAPSHCLHNIMPAFPGLRVLDVSENIQYKYAMKESFKMHRRVEGDNISYVKCSTEDQHQAAERGKKREEWLRELQQMGAKLVQYDATKPDQSTSLRNELKNIDVAMGAKLVQYDATKPDQSTSLRNELKNIDVAVLIPPCEHSTQRNVKDEAQRMVHETKAMLHMLEQVKIHFKDVSEEDADRVLRQCPEVTPFVRHLILEKMELIKKNEYNISKNDLEKYLHSKPESISSFFSHHKDEFKPRQ
ncbi:hypothetical protein GQ42DRAFT_181337 [Ramicandelaber brevisporus]|nr:hypothetical protein GQ42DRAFT_181337 [Ramicandelaber brevisporus]